MPMSLACAKLMVYMGHVLLPCPGRFLVDTPAGVVLVTANRMPWRQRAEAGGKSEPPV